MWWLCFLLATLTLINGMHESSNFALPPAKRWCFYEDFDDNTPLKVVEVFVESGGSLDVLLSVHGPLSLQQVREETFEGPIYVERVDSIKASESDSSTFTADLKPATPGTYGICLDNRNAHFLTKRVQLDVRTAKRPEPVAVHIGGEPRSAKNAKNKEEDKGESAVIQVKESLERVRKGLKLIQVQQQVDRHRLQLHSATRVMENNRVVTGSIVETVFFIAAALFQIFFVRRWFASRNSLKVSV
jgi:hypothetical protein